MSGGRAGEFTAEEPAELVRVRLIVQVAKLQSVAMQLRLISETERNTKEEKYYADGHQET
jgi:hypothetical protein